MELLLPRTKGILVGACYRPPSCGNFLPKLEQALSKVEPGKELFILGDINIDASRSSSLLSRYVDTLGLFGCTQLISEPTRVTPTSSTTLNHVIVNSGENIKGHGVIEYGVSDHFAVFCSRGVPKGSLLGSIIKKVRSMKSYNPTRFRTELARINWRDIMISTDVDFCLNEFTRLFKIAVDTVAPVREVRVKQRSNPWMNSHLLAGIKKRDVLLRQFKRSKDESV